MRVNGGYDDVGDDDDEQLSDVDYAQLMGANAVVVVEGDDGLNRNENDY